MRPLPRATVISAGSPQPPEKKKTRKEQPNLPPEVAARVEQLREEIAASYPEAWARIEARRAFMIETLGIQLKPEVLPFSNIPAFLPPFWLARDKAMAVTGR